MQKPRVLVSASVIAVAVTAGAVGGALLFTPSSSGAQDGATTTTTAPERRFRDDGPRPGRLGGSLDVAAKALVMEASALRDELQGGKTIADVAKEKDVEIQTVIDALVADAKAKLQQLEDDLPQRMSDLVNAKLQPGHDGFGHGPRGGPFGGFRARLDVAAKSLGTDESTLRDELQGGKSIADVAKEKDVDVQTVIDAMVTAANEKIDQAVTDGRLPSDKADEIKSHTKGMITALVNGQRPPRSDRPWGGDAPASEAAA